jgi:HSP20 family protein
MSTLLRRDPRTMFPELVEWFEEPFLTLRPYLAQAIRVEDFVEDDHYLVRAELAGIDPEKDVEVTVGSGYLTIRAERHDKTEGKHRTEFRYGSFSRSLPMPANADPDDVKATYDHGILTVSVGLKAEKKDEVKKIEVKPAK